MVMVEVCLLRGFADGDPYFTCACPDRVLGYIHYMQCNLLHCPTVLYVFPVRPLEPLPVRRKTVIKHVGCVPPSDMFRNMCIGVAYDRVEQVRSFTDHLHRINVQVFGDESQLAGYAERRPVDMSRDKQSAEPVRFSFYLIKGCTSARPEGNVLSHRIMFSFRSITIWSPNISGSCGTFVELFVKPFLERDPGVFTGAG